MERINIDVALLQETWLSGNLEKDINGLRLIHHGLNEFKSNRGERGVAIIMPPLSKYRVKK